jgi:putative membrane protein
MNRLLLRFLVNALALYLAVWLVPGLHYQGSAGRFLLVAVVFGLVNSLLRPLLTILTCPLVIATLGIFTLVINAVLLLTTGWLSQRWGLGLAVNGFWAAFAGGIVVSIASIMLSLGMRSGGPRV